MITPALKWRHITQLAVLTAQSPLGLFRLLPKAHSVSVSLGDKLLCNSLDVEAAKLYCELHLRERARMLNQFLM